MAVPRGYNPLRYDCSSQGCFNKKKRPKIELFADCFPGAINFSDVDGRVEINGQFLELEWKSHDGGLPTGQRIMFERLTRSGQITVFVVCGDAETMDVDKYAMIYRGRNLGWHEITLSGLKMRMRNWAAWAQGHVI